MKKQSLLLITGGLLALASCNTNTAGNDEEMQAKVDSMVNERVEEIRLELQMRNDSLINEMAMYRADSIMAAMSGKKVASRPKPKPKTDIVTKEEAKQENQTIGNGKPKMGNNNPNEIGNGKPKMGNTNQNEVGSGKPKMGGN